jgi:alkanesulfonate monooxygenase SsuD/methylene tetrahydromethanopterin reductase-like flavin-dependent oxidoreductase (luciferase family)
MDEAIDLLRACWREERIDHDGRHFELDAIAMEPKPPQAGGLPIWIGGNSPRALRRVAEKGDGWLATSIVDADAARRAIETIHRQAEAGGRDPGAIGLQQMLDVPPRDERGKRFYQDLDQVAARADELQELGFGWGAVNATAIFQSGARSVEAIIDVLGRIHDRLRTVTGPAT